MRIVHVEDRFHPGMGYQINYMARYHGREHEFIILTSDSVSIWDNLTKEKLASLDNAFEQENQVRIIRLPACMAKGQKSNVWIKGMTKKLKELNPDAIFAHCVENYSTIRIILRFAGSDTLIATDTHTLKNQFYGGLKEKIYFSLHKRLVVNKVNKHRIKTFYTASENKQILEEVYGIDKRLIHPCPIGTDFNIFKYNEEAGHDLRKSHSIGDDDLILLYTGKINYRKQPHLILEAVKQIEDNIEQPLVLFFVGHKEKAYYTQEFKPSFKNNLIRVIEINSVPNEALYKYYSMADFAVFPKENTLSALDAQACKLPLIMQNDMTNRERLEKGGLLYDEDNIADLGHKIRLMVMDKSKRKSLAEDGFSYVEENFNYKNIIKQTEDTFLGSS